MVGMIIPWCVSFFILYEDWGTAFSLIHRDGWQNGESGSGQGVKDCRLSSELEQIKIPESGPSTGETDIYRQVLGWVRWTHFISSSPLCTFILLSSLAPVSSCKKVCKSDLIMNQKLQTKEMQGVQSHGSVSRTYPGGSCGQRHSNTWASWKKLLFVYLLLAVLGHCCGRTTVQLWGSDFSLQWLLLTRRLGPRVRELSKLLNTGLVAQLHVESSQTRGQTCVPCISRRILNHGTTREVPWKEHFI